MPKAELVLDCRCEHGEATVWDAAEGKLWWVDVEQRRIWWFAPDNGESGFYQVPGRPCCVAPRRQGGLILAMAEGIALFSPPTGALKWLHRFEPEKPHTRLNDGKIDRQGRFVVGGLNERDGARDTSVIRIGADHSMTTLIEGICCANAICFSPDGKTMFFADTPERMIRAYPYSAGEQGLGRATIFADFALQPGQPDGSCVDIEGGVWNAQWKGGRVVRIAPDGGIDHVIDLPVSKVTCCAFGGPNLETLFIITSRLGDDPARTAAEPHAGSLFALTPGVRGVLDPAFAG